MLRIKGRYDRKKWYILDVKINNTNTCFVYCYQTNWFEKKNIHYEEIRNMIERENNGL